jgi:hypothetical protein
VGDLGGLDGLGIYRVLYFSVHDTLMAYLTFTEIENPGKKTIEKDEEHKGAQRA